MEFDRYKFYQDKSNHVYAVSSYAGQTVRGVAKCSPNDTFDYEKGRELAVKRCDLKIAQKRLKRAYAEKDKAQKAFYEAKAKLAEMEEYERDAIDKYNEASFNYNEYLTEM